MADKVYTVEVNQFPTPAVPDAFRIVEYTAMPRNRYLLDAIQKHRVLVASVDRDMVRTVLRALNGAIACR